eukprot:gene16836-biopygen5294
MPPVASVAILWHAMDGYSISPTIVAAIAATLAAAGPGCK